jgi:hypothetical protein
MAIALQPVKAVQEKTKIATKPRRVVVTGIGQNNKAVVKIEQEAEPMHILIR